MFKRIKELFKELAKQETKLNQKPNIIQKYPVVYKGENYLMELKDDKILQGTYILDSYIYIYKCKKEVFRYDYADIVRAVRRTPNGLDIVYNNIPEEDLLVEVFKYVFKKYIDKIESEAVGKRLVQIQKENLVEWDGVIND